MRVQGGWEASGGFRALLLDTQRTVMMCFPGLLSSVYRDCVPWHQVWRTRESSKSAPSGGQDNTTHHIPKSKPCLQAHTPSLRPVAATSRPLSAALPSLTPLQATLASTQQLARTKLPAPWSLQMNAVPSAWNALRPAPPGLPPSPLLGFCAAVTRSESSPRRLSLSPDSSLLSS